MCGEMMAFPDTVEEFMEQYKMVDREQIYSNGCEYVPIYRMKQWFAHKPQIDLIRCGECKHWHEGKWYNTCDKHIGHGFEAEHFCSDGERRADEHTD